ncbi:MAG: hypothetical protein Q9170_006372, partial [Blastenia crenularia]
GDGVSGCEIPPPPAPTFPGLLGMRLRAIVDFNKDRYYVPFYLQAAQGVSASTSGVRFIALALPEVVAIVITGALVTKTGHYVGFNFPPKQSRAVPYIILGSIVSIVGTGLLTRLDLETRNFEWASYLVLTGFGIGLALQVPFMTLQVVLRAMAVAAGGAIVLNSLSRHISKATGELSALDVIQAGATNLAILTNDPRILRLLRTSYSRAITDTIYLSLAAAAIALPFASAMEWKNVKRVSREKASTEACMESDKGQVSSSMGK